MTLSAACSVTSRKEAGGNTQLLNTGRSKHFHPWGFDYIQPQKMAPSRHEEESIPGNLAIICSRSHDQHFLKISWKSVGNWLSYCANKQIIAG